ncbi:MAG: tetratricopeptide repeat protein [bacterium]
MRCRPYLFFSLIISISLLSGCSKQSERKIQLSDTASNQKTRIQTASSVLQVTPEQQHSIAILSFQNNTGDASLDWLSRGLADMLATELSQSLYINVVPMNRLYESLKQIGKKAEDLNNQSIALEVAKHTQAENILTGSFYQEDESLKIYVMLRDVETGQVLRKDFVQGPGLERIFAMVDELSTRLRTNLRGDLETAPVTKSPLAAMTQSIEAFRCYSKALENMDQLFYAEADTCLRQAIEIDSTFAAAYLLQSRVKAHSGDNKAASSALRQARRYADKLSESDRIWLRFIEAQLAGDISKILTAMQELLQYEPNDIETRMQLGSLLLKLEDYDRALAEYELIMELDPNRKLVYNQLGYVHAHRGEFNTALKYLDKYAELAPDEPNPYDSKGEVLMMAGRLQEAAKQYEMALAKRPNFGNAALQLSDLYGELGNLNRALKYSDHWIAEQSNELWIAEAYVKRALLHWRFGQITMAKEALKIAQKKWPNLISVGLIGGEMYKATGDTSAALHLYKFYFDRYKKMVVNNKQDFSEIH